MELANANSVCYSLQEKIFRKRLRRRRQRLLVSEVLVEYARNSTLHGLRYVAERRLPVFEKIFWLVTFVASLSMCSYHISNVYVKWQTSPVIVTVSEKLVPVSEVPFPSVTICPQIKSKATVFNYHKHFSAMIINQTAATDDDYVRFFDVDLMCRIQDMRFFLLVSDDEKYANGAMNRTLYATIKEVSPKCNETLLECIWHGYTFNCCNVFKTVYTSEGICFNFNGIAAKQLFRNKSRDLGRSVIDTKIRMKGWNPTTGYNNSIKRPFPNRANANRAVPDLVVELLSDEDNKDLLCNSANSGFKIYLHNFLDLPQSSLYYYAALEDQVTSLAVNLNILNTSETLLNYDPIVRQCYFPKEKYLRFFKVYTAKNCQAECLANITVQKCNCVAYYMPHEINTTICRERTKIMCVEKARDEIITGKSAMESEDVCGCLPPCYYVEYDAEVLKTKYNIPPTQREAIIFNMSSLVPWFFSDDKSLKYSRLEVYFKKSRYLSMRRSELFGWTDFVANIGGLLGVFLGFSFLSLVEIIYFATIRIGVALKRDREGEKIDE